MSFAPEGPRAIPLWINGRAYLTIAKDFFDVFDRQGGQILRRVPLCGSVEIAAAVEAAAMAQEAWAALGLAGRCEALGRLADELAALEDHFVRLLLEESGGTPEQGRAELGMAQQTLRAHTMGERAHSGLLGLIVGVERPLANLLQGLVPALLAGATVVIKPSPAAPSAILALAELCTRAAWPGGVVNVVHGDDALVEVLRQSGVDRLLVLG